MSASEGFVWSLSPLGFIPVLVARADGTESEPEPAIIFLLAILGLSRGARSAVGGLHDACCRS